MEPGDAAVLLLWGSERGGDLSVCVCTCVNVSVRSLASSLCGDTDPAAVCHSEAAVGIVMMTMMFPG